MKLKKFWIPTLLLGIIGGGAKLCDTLLNNGEKGFFLSSDVCNYIFVGTIILLLLIGYIMLIAQRKTKVTVNPEKNIFAGVFGFLASVAVLGSGVIAMLSLGAQTNRLENVITCICGICGGIVMLYESCISITGHNGLKNAPLLALALPIWACGRLVVLFMDYSKVSIHSTEMYDVVSTSLLCLFLYYQAMLFAEINTAKAFKRSMVYGCCFTMCGLITTADIIIKMFFPVKAANSNIDVLTIEPTLARILLCSADIAFCFYAIFLLAGIARKAKFESAEEPDDDEDDDESEKPAVKIEKEEKKSPIQNNRSYEGVIAAANHSADGNADGEGMKEPEPFSGTALRFEDTITVDRNEIKKKMLEMSEEKPAVAEENLTVESEPAAVDNSLTFDSVSAPIENGHTFENVAAFAEENKPEPVSEPGPVADPVKDEPVYEPVKAEEVYKPQPAKEVQPEISEQDTEEEDFENVFLDESGEVNYDEIFDLLDSMSKEMSDED